MKYVVLYRTGGRARWRWHKVCVDYTDISVARRDAAGINSQGYAVAIFDRDVTANTAALLPFNVQEEVGVVEVKPWLD